MRDEVSLYAYVSFYMSKSGISMPSAYHEHLSSSSHLVHGNKHIPAVASPIIRTTYHAIILVPSPIAAHQTIKLAIHATKLAPRAPQVCLRRTQQRPQPATEREPDGPESQWFGPLAPCGAQATKWPGGNDVRGASGDSAFDPWPECPYARLRPLPTLPAGGRSPAARQSKNFCNRKHLPC